MSDDYSLNGMKVLVPRGKKHAKPFSDLVKKYGGIPVEIPLISFRPVASDNLAIFLRKKLHKYDWIIFTSNVTVETFFSFDINPTVLEHIQIAAIGEKTEEALVRKGVTVAFKPKEYVAEAFVEEFSPRINARTNVLIPKGNLARELISTTLEKKGAHVDELVIYETFFPDSSRDALVKALTEKKIDIISFTSPSTVDHFMAVVKEMNILSTIDHCLFMCIGPITFQRANALGLRVDAMPDTYTIDHMLQSMMKIIRKRENK
ncbi:uroporphyrinogen-III synthase [Bacillus coreaensis]